MRGFVSERLARVWCTFHLAAAPSAVSSCIHVPSPQDSLALDLIDSTMGELNLYAHECSTLALMSEALAQGNLQTYATEPLFASAPRREALESLRSGLQWEARVSSALHRMHLVVPNSTQSLHCCNLYDISLPLLPRFFRLLSCLASPVLRLFCMQRGGMGGRRLWGKGGEGLGGTEEGDHHSKWFSLGPALQFAHLQGL